MSILITKKDVAIHMAQIFESWEGTDMTLRKKVIVTDGNGKIVSSSNVDTPIKGIISALPYVNRKDMAGYVEDRELRGVFLWTGDISTMPVVEDRIINSLDTLSSATYIVEKILTVDLDIDEPVVMTCQLREVPDEA